MAIVELKDQVCPFNQALKLKELGVIQSSVRNLAMWRIKEAKTFSL